MSPPTQSQSPGVTCKDGHTSFVLYAPFANSATVVLPDMGARYEMEKVDEAYFMYETDRLGPGTRYLFQTDSMSEPRPDPASLWQPEGVHGMSVIVDEDLFSRKQPYFTGRELDDMVIYELHIGTFSKAGTFQGAIEHLSNLVKLGVNTIQLLPINQFPGQRNWGYDGVYWCAVQDSYGGPKGLLEFIDAAHDLSLAVIVDAVYNHLGPEGNYLPEFGPYLKTDQSTPWGASINLDGTHNRGVRDLIISSAYTWLVKYGADGLRLDAVHELHDSSETHIVKELGQYCKGWSNMVGKPLTLIGEIDNNDKKFITPLEQGGLGLHGQWADDFHHALRAYFTGDTSDYYSKFGSIDSLANAMQNAFVHNKDQHSESTSPEPQAYSPKVHQYVVFGQNHDQVGNRILGDRLNTNLSEDDYILQAAIYLWSPFTPMLFMGEEYAEQNPFPFFVDHSSRRLLKQTKRGRLGSFSKGLKEAYRMPDPGKESTFQSAKLSHVRSGRVYRFYREALAVRRQFWWQRIRAIDAHWVSEIEQGVLGLRMPLTDGRHLIVVFNLGSSAWQVTSGSGKWSLEQADLRCATTRFRGVLPGKQAAVWLK